MFVAAIYTLATAASNEILLFPSGAVPGELSGCTPEVHVNTVYSPLYTGLEITNVSAPSFTPYLVSNGTGAAVVIAPGGGYHILAWDKEGAGYARRLNAMGVSAFVLKYRVPSGHGSDGFCQRAPNASLPWAWAPLMDAQRAIGMVRHRASQYGLDPKKIGFMGSSAGGHLTAHISTTWRDRLYARIDAADDESCRPDFSMLVYPWKLLKDDDKTATELSPELPVDAETPPALLVHNQDDPVAWPTGSLEYARQLTLSASSAADAAPPSTLHLYTRGGHGFGLCQDGKEATPAGGFAECCDWTLAAQRWLQEIGAAPGWPAAPCDAVWNTKGGRQCEAL